MALINQSRVNAGLGPIGLLNSKIYSLIGTSCFRDITVGNNITPKHPITTYQASVGYDLCTGLGSPMVRTLATQLSQTPQIAVSPTSLGMPGVQIHVTSSGTFTIANPGTLPLVVFSISYPTGFQGNWSSGTVAAGGSQAITVSSTPTVAGTTSGTISIASNAPSGTTTLPFSLTATLPPQPPLVLTNPVSGVGANSATLNALVNPDGAATTAYFQYGPTPAYGSTTSFVSAGTTGNAPFTQTISGLASKTSLHYRVVAVNALGTVYGSDMSFATLAQPTLGSLAVISHDGAGATVAGTVAANGVATTVYIQYGTTPAYGSQSAGMTLAAGTSATSLSTILSGLQPGVTYYCRIETISAAGTYYGTQQTFTSAPFTVATAFTTGAAAPGITGAQFATFSDPAINDQDNLAFKATLKPGYGGVTAATGTGIWAADLSGTTKLVTQEGVAAPGTTISVKNGTATANFATFSDPVYNNLGQVAFSATLAVGPAAPASTASGIWTNSGGSLALAARLGAQAPGCATGVNFTSFSGLALPDQGGVLILANVSSGNTTAMGIWEGTSVQDLAVLARTGTVIGGKIVTGLSILPNSAVQTRSFTQEASSLACVITFSDNTTGILTLVGDTWSMATQTSGAAPGVANGQFASFGSPLINARNHTAFAAKLKTGTSGIWADSALGSRNLVAAIGQSAPDTTSTYSSLNDPVDNSSDTVAFMAKLTNGVTGIWSGGHLVANTSGAAAGCTPGINFSGFAEMALPDQGGVVFVGTVAGAGITTANNTGIWAVDSTNALNLLLRTGDTLGGKTISTLSFLPEKLVIGSQTRSFSQASGDLACLATNTDGTTSILRIVFP